MAPLKKYILVILLSVSINTQAQGGDPGEDPDAPIDGGLTFLLAGSIAYGIKRLHDAGKNKKLPPQA